MSRRRRLNPVAAAAAELRETLGDAALVGLYVMGINQSVSSGVLDSWADARGTAGFGPALAGTLTARPAVGGSGILTFDGTDDYLRASAGLGGITQDCALAIVGTLPTTGAGAEVMADLADGSANSILSLRRDVTNGSYLVLGGGASSATVAAVAGTITMHGRRTGTGASSPTGARIGTGAEGTALSSLVAQTAASLTIGANRVATPAQFADFTCRAVLVYAGNYASGTQYEAVARFGVSLGAAA